MKMRKTNRGFRILEFTDLYNTSCSLQESSLVSPDAVWLGCGDNRMHLNQDMARELIYYLNYFQEHGSLPDEDESSMIGGVDLDITGISSFNLFSFLGHMKQVWPELHWDSEEEDDSTWYFIYRTLAFHDLCEEEGVTDRVAPHVLCLLYHAKSATMTLIGNSEEDLEFPKSYFEKQV